MGREERRGTMARKSFSFFLSFLVIYLYVYVLDIYGEDQAFVCFRDAHYLRIISVQEFFSRFFFLLLSAILLFCLSNGQNMREHARRSKDDEEEKFPNVDKSLMIEFLLLSVDVSGVCKNKRTIPYRNSSCRWIVKL